MNLTLDPDEYVERLHQNIKSTWNQGAEAERERILKLLEPLAEHDELCKHGCYPEDCSAAQYEYAIALVKGEQK
jgi:ArsR family metal-binding transcriptional regulator